MSTGVAPDGSPVDVYLALPAGETPALIDSVLPPRCSILELGSGPGRISRPLLDLGHRVLAVDNAPEMLAHLTDTETMLADLFSLDLERTFDAVVAGSHLINAPDAASRRALLLVCRRHVGQDGVVLIERYEPAWAAAPSPTRTRIGRVHVNFEPIALTSASFRGRVTYTLGVRRWTQEFTAAHVTEDTLHAEAEAAGLQLSGWLDEARTWARLAPL